MSIVPLSKKNVLYLNLKWSSLITQYRDVARGEEGKGVAGGGFPKNRICPKHKTCFFMLRFRLHTRINVKSFEEP